MVTYNESIKLIFGLKLRTLRLQRGLNLQQLSKATDIALSYLHDIEAGKKYPKADKISVLATALSVDYDYMVSLTAGKHLQPIIDLVSSDFINVIPWAHFGLTPSSLLDLFANAPNKVTAFISTVLKLSRSVQMSKENFYTSALRSYQDLHDNYFEDLEADAFQFRKNTHLEDAVPISYVSLEAIIKNQYGIKVDKKVMATKVALQKLRSFYNDKKRILYINKGLSLTQEKFLLGREIAFQLLKLEPRPYETIVQSAQSFDVLLNNFKASYFSSALLMPEEILIKDIKLLTSSATWNGQGWLDLLDKYDVTPEILMQRLTSILPGAFAIEQLFFLRLSGKMDIDYYDITKELHLSQLHNPYANNLSEHYCRRWVAIDTMKAMYEKVKKNKSMKPIIHVQTSEYWQTNNRYFCISIVKPPAKGSSEIVSVTIGMMIDAKLSQTMPFIYDANIPVKTVHTTCERCGIMDCLERAAPPKEILKELEFQNIQQALNQMNE